MESLPTIGLLTARMDGWYQSQAWHGVSAAARILGIRVCAFVGSAFGDPDLHGGPSEIHSLVGSPEMDGYLVLTGVLANFRGVSPVSEFVRSLPPLPTLSIGVPLPGFPAIVPDGGGMDELARHLLGTHGFRRIAYIGGPLTNPDAVRRLDDWHRTLVDFGIEPDRRLEFEGDFTPSTGRAIMERILDFQELPRAVICANDAMALGAHAAIVARGFSIPQDIVLAGYDDIEEARAMVPPLTTVRSSTYQLAFRATEMLHRRLRGEHPEPEIMKTELVVRRSCGCRPGSASQRLPRLLAEAAGIPDSMGIRHFLSDPDTVDIFLLRMEKALEVCEHAEIDHWEESLAAAGACGSMSPDFAQSLVAAQTLVSQARHGLDIRRRQALQHLMREQFSAVQSLTANPSADRLAERILDALKPFAGAHLRLLLFRDDLTALSQPLFGEEPFQLEIDLAKRYIGPPPAEGILPEGDERPGTWATLSLSLGQEHYGIVQVRDWSSNELFMESLRHSLTLLLSSSQKAAQESLLRERLRTLSHRDELTGLLNRRGLLEQGQNLAQMAMRANREVGVMLCDLDGLKKINDEHGHADGDLAIQCLARSLEDGFRQSDVLARLGGDEFAVVAMLGKEGTLAGAVDRVRKSLLRRSRDLKKPWHAHTSAGWIAWNPGDGHTLASVLSEADRLLYSDKRLRKDLSSHPTSVFPETWETDS